MFGVVSFILPLGDACARVMRQFKQAVWSKRHYLPFYGLILWLATVLGTVRAPIEDALVFLIDDGGGVSYYTAHQFAKVIVGVCCKIRRRRM